MKNINDINGSFLFFLTKKRGTGRLGLFLLFIILAGFLQILPGTASAQYIPLSDPACAYCGAFITRGESHKPGCPYYSNQGGNSAERKQNSWDVNLIHRRNRAQNINAKGDNALKTKEFRKAISYYRRALWYSPFDETIKRNLAQAREERKSYRSTPKPVKPAKPVKPVHTANSKPVISKDEMTFLDGLVEESAVYKSQLDKLRQNMRGVVPPLTSPTKNIHEGIILGTTNTQEQNKVVKLNLKSPFNDKTQALYASSVDSTNWDFKRAILDNFTSGQYTLKQTEYGRELVKKLNGTHFDRLIAHSNGATVADALIQENVITVDELNIIGGDRAYVNWAEYNALISSGRVKRIVVWINPGDDVPIGTSVLSGLFHSAKFAKYFGEYATNILSGSKGGHGVEYRILPEEKYKCGEGMFGPHGIDCYFNNIKKYFN